MKITFKSSSFVDDNTSPVPLQLVALIGAISGAAAGAMLGPVGLVAGGFAGSAAGALAGLALARPIKA